MRALLYDAWEHLTMTDLDQPTAGEGEVLLKVAAVGICGSELEAFRKRSPRRVPPLVLGHEFCGEVVAVGPSVSKLKVGDRVVSNSVIPCGDCGICRRGLGHACPNRRLFGMQLPGAMAEYVAVPERVTIPWHPELSAAQAAMAEPLGNGMHVAGLAGPTGPEKAVVFGAGPIGLMCMMALRAVHGSEVVMVDTNPDRLVVAERLGAVKTLKPDQLDEIKAWTDGDGADVAVDAVGAQATKLGAVHAVRNGGAAIWIGLHANEDPFPAYDLVLTEKRVLGSYATTQEELAGGLELVRQGKIDVSSWTSEFTLEQGVEAFHQMLTPGSGDLKAVLIPGA
ncbi:MAG: zinc-dependent alcohol dehydrogenase [Fimbriimonas sp.]